mgnify:CR=1 FL=1
MFVCLITIKIISIKKIIEYFLFQLKKQNIIFWIKIYEYIVEILINPEKYMKVI